MGLFNWLFGKKKVQPITTTIHEPFDLVHEVDVFGFEQEYDCEVDCEFEEVEPCPLDYDFMAREVVLENYNPNTGLIDKVSAIKLFRKRTGMGLKESKQYIDNNS